MAKPKPETLPPKTAEWAAKMVTQLMRHFAKQERRIAALERRAARDAALNAGRE